MKCYFLALGTLLIVCVGCAGDGQQLAHRDEYVAPPAAMLAHPGPMVGGPGPGVMQAAHFTHQHAVPAQSTQVNFLGPEGMSIGWQIGHGFADNQLLTPQRYNFTQGATYRLKFANIPRRQGMTIYPSLHVYPAHPTTQAFLSHNTIPIRITPEDLNQIATNNFVTKVIYLPDPKHQDLAVANVEELVSTRLGPGLDPVHEADRMGTIMVVLRMGNMDLEMPGAIPAGGVGPNGEVWPASYVQQVDGEQEQWAPPVPIGNFLMDGTGVPGDVILGGPAGPGMPPYEPISGMYGAPMYGMPFTGTPIGLPGPPHIPLGRPAGLRTHTMRNLSDNHIPQPVEDLLIDVRHEPGINMPEPVRHIQYTETHPIYHEGEVSRPAWAAP
jgi:hypothetical protein